jgi:uncharacterized protein (TIGR02145 family)
LTGATGVGISQANIIADSLLITLSNGQILNAGQISGGQGTIGGLPSGTQSGQILYWNGTSWVTVSPGTRGQSLIMCDGIPSWGGCLPQVTTASITSIFASRATCGGTVVSDGGSMITTRGVVYGGVPNPSLLDRFTTNGSGLGAYSSILTGLSPLTSYFARAYATNGIGTAYGNSISFTTIAFTCGITSVVDIDNNVYNTIPIGSQCWLQRNLTVSKYRNGDNIQTGLSNSQWETTTSGAYSTYNDVSNDIIYGKLYNLYAVDDVRGVCPTEWHVATDSEWNVMIKYIDPNADTTITNGYQNTIAGGSLKSTTGWESPNSGATNSTGFTALPGGYKYNTGGIGLVPRQGEWWVGGGPSRSRGLYFSSPNVYRGSDSIFQTVSASGRSVRCARD